MREDAFRYLMAEHTQLVAAFFALLAESRSARHDPARRATYLAKLHAHEALVANHRLAREYANSLIPG
jgi:hypothetical protein